MKRFNGTNGQGAGFCVLTHADAAAATRRMPWSVDSKRRPGDQEDPT